MRSNSCSGRHFENRKFGGFTSLGFRPPTFSGYSSGIAGPPDAVCSFPATVIIASHNLALIEEMNKRTVVLSDGELIGDFSQTKS